MPANGWGWDVEEMPISGGFTLAVPCLTDRCAAVRRVGGAGTALEGRVVLV